MPTWCEHCRRSSARRDRRKGELDFTRRRWLEDIVLAIKQLIVDELDLRSREPSEIDTDAPLFGDGLGLDSLDALQLAVAIEERFFVSIPQDDEAKTVLATVRSIAEHVTSSQKR